MCQCFFTSLLTLCVSLFLPTAIFLFSLFLKKPGKEKCGKYLQCNLPLVTEFEALGKWYRSFCTEPPQLSCSTLAKIVSHPSRQKKMSVSIFHLWEPGIRDMRHLHVVRAGCVHASEQVGFQQPLTEHLVKEASREEWREVTEELVHPRVVDSTWHS